MKQRKLNKRKGFTLVELLVVIAILAVLATVSVVGYTSFIKKAKVSNDENLVAQLNTALKADEITDGKPATPTEMLEVMEENGFKVENLTPTTSKYNIVWNQEKNEFALLDEKNNTVFGEVSKDLYKNWKFTNTYVEDGYSSYLKGESVIESLTINVGFDSGKNIVSTLNYVNDGDSQSVTIKTNGGVFNVNAKDDTIYHYGVSDNVVITAIAGESYHENGEVTGNIEIESGHIKVENTASVVAIVAKPASSSTVKVTVTNENSVNEIVTTDTSKTTFDVPEDVKPTTTTDTKIKEISNFAGGLGTEKSPYLIKTGDQAWKMRNGSGYFKLMENVIVTNEIYLSGKVVTLDLNGHSITLKYAEDVKPNNGGVLNISGKKSKLTINDSSEAKTGAIYGSEQSFANKVTSAVRVGNYGTLIINGGNFYGTSEETSCIFVMTSSSSSNKATVTINGGYFETTNSFNKNYYVLNHQDNETTGCTITVNGGTFINYNPGVTVVDKENAYTGKISLGEGCTTTEEIKNGKTYYTVSK